MTQRSRFFDSTGVAVTLATSAAADDIIDTTTPHGFVSGQPVHFTALTGGAGLTVGTIYWVTPTSLGASTFRVAASPGGADLGFTTDITAGTVVGGDRVYSAAAWAEVVAGLATDGVIWSAVGTELATSESGPPAMSVRVNLGRAFVQGYFFEVFSGQETLAISAAHATLARIDRVVLRRDLTGRTAVLAVLTGTPAGSPVAPSLTQNVAGIYEIPLSQVAVGAAVASIVNANITDQRGTRSREPALTAELLNASGHRHEGTDATGRKVQHADLSGLTANDHHAQSHGHTGGDSSGTVSHANLTSVTADQHHARSHDHSSASDGSTLSPATLLPDIVRLNEVIEATDFADASDNNNWNPAGLATCNVIRVGVVNGGGGQARITGIVAQASGRLILLINDPPAGSVSSIAIQVEDGLSTAANRFSGFSGVTLRAGMAVFIYYDGAESRWRWIGPTLI